jgi:Tol biopolymer transport system component
VALLAGSALLTGSALLAACAPQRAVSAGPSTERASVSSRSAEADGESFAPALSGDGRLVAFESSATNLVADDTNGVPDVFVRDLVSGTTTRVSVSSDGTAGDGRSYDASISGDGRWVAFTSEATNLVEGDTNAFTDVFLHDRRTGRTTRVSVAPDGTQVACNSWDPALSEDGSAMSFTSGGDGLVPGEETTWAGVFAADLATGVIERVSVSMDGTELDGVAEMSAISADGRFVTFVSDAGDLVAEDTNDLDDVFVRDRAEGTTTRVSVSSTGAQASGYSGAPSSSGDGRYVAFFSLATDLVEGDDNGRFDVFVHDRASGETSLASVDAAGQQGDGDSGSPSISSDGRYVAFVSDAANLVQGDTNGAGDVIVHDRVDGGSRRASVASGGGQADGASMSPAVSGDGSVTVFVSSATDLVGDDGNGAGDVFVRR